MIHYYSPFFLQKKHEKVRLGILLGWIVMTSTKLNVWLPSLKLPVLPWKQAFLRQWNPPVLDHDSHQAITEFAFLGVKCTYVACDFIGYLKKVPRLWPRGPNKREHIPEIVWLPFFGRNLPTPKSVDSSDSLILKPLWILLLIMLLHHLSQCGHKSLAWCG